MGSQQREHLDGLSQAHVVREDSAEAVLTQEGEPAEAVALVVAQRASEAARLLQRPDALEGLELVAQLGERRVDVRRCHRGELGVDQQGLGGQELEAAVRRVVSEVGERAVGFDPRRRQQALRAVLEVDEAVAPPHRGEDLLQLHPVPGEVGRAGDLEPVDAALDLERRRIRGA